MAMQARDACRKMPVTVTADATVTEAAEAMNSQAVEQSWWWTALDRSGS